MTKFSLQKIRRGLETDEVLLINDRTFSWFLLFIFGLVVGRLFAGRLGSNAFLIFADVSAVSFDAVFFLLLLFFSTSFLGGVFIPLAVFARAIFFAFSVMSAYALSGGISGIIYSAAVPALIAFPAFFLIADDCARLSAQLFELRFSCMRGMKRLPFFRHLILTAILLSIDFVYCIYIMPNLVS